MKMRPLQQRKKKQVFLGHVVDTLYIQYLIYLSQKLFEIIILLMFQRWEKPNFEEQTFTQLPWLGLEFRSWLSWQWTLCSSHVYRALEKHVGFVFDWEWEQNWESWDVSKRLQICTKLWGYEASATIATKNFRTFWSSPKHILSNSNRYYPLTF